MLSFRPYLTYNDIDEYIPKNTKPQRIVEVCKCCKCGKVRVTLLKIDGDFVCKECVEKNFSKNNEK